MTDKAPTLPDEPERINFGKGHDSNEAYDDAMKRYARALRQSLLAERGRAEKAEKEIIAMRDYGNDGWKRAEAAEKDAGRYRHLRDADAKTGEVSAHVRVYDGYHFHIGGEKLDAAIDAAIKGAQ